MTLFEKSTFMQIVPFPTHYQLVYTNFDFSSFSLISCKTIWANLKTKTDEIDEQFRLFCII